MTSSELERRPDARAQVLRRISVRTIVPFVLDRPNSSR